MASIDPPLVYVITLNWNRRDDTLGFLASFSQLTYPNYRLAVVDNGSTDNSVQAIAAQFPGVEQIVNTHNLGFAAGANQAIKHALIRGADYVFVANNDTFIASDALDLMMDVAMASDIGLVAPKIYYAHDPQRIWWAGGQRDGLTMDVTGGRRGYLDEDPCDAPFEVDFITGCGMLIRRQCLEEIGLFDERFFMYYEDWDYCLRIHSVGYRVVIVPRAKMWHKMAASTGGSDSPLERYYMARNSIPYFRKHVRGWRWLFVVPYRTGSAVKTVTRLLRNHQPESVWAYLRGLWHGFRF